MIRAEFKKGDGKYSASIYGHAEYAPEGLDLVCAAASTLVQSAAEMLSRTEGTALLRLVLKKGLAELEFSGDEKAEGAYLVMLCGFESLAAKYPEHVRISEGFPKSLAEKYPKYVRIREGSRKACFLGKRSSRR